jgi:hypothetical protein
MQISPAFPRVAAIPKKGGWEEKIYKREEKGQPKPPGKCPGCPDSEKTKTKKRGQRSMRAKNC